MSKRGSKSHSSVLSGTKPWQSVRKTKVERARKLVKDPDYPTKQVTNAVADLLARHLDKLKE